MNKSNTISNIRDFKQYSLTEYNQSKNYINFLDDEDKPKTITIELSEKNFNKLNEKRIEAIKTGVLITDSKDFVKAKIRYNNTVYDAKIRLKGDWTDHLKQDKWSMRIQLSDNKTLFGMNEFSIQNPATRNYLYEWLYHKFLGYNDIIFLRYNFINCNLNIRKKAAHDVYKKLGIFAIEEGFDKLLIEHNKRREGIIVKLNEDAMWKERALAGADKGSPYLNSINSSYIDVFSRKKVLTDNVFSKQFNLAQILLESYLNKRLKMSDVFDIDKFTSFIAASNLLGAQHGLIWHNMRLYFNPITTKFEPIGFDGDAGQSINDILTLEWYGRFTGDLEYYKKLASYLEKYSEKVYIDNFMSSINKELNNNVNILRIDYPIYKYNDKFLKNNQFYIRNAINPTTSFIAYWEEISNNKVTLKFRSMSDFPIEIMNMHFKDETIITLPHDQYLLMPHQTSKFTFILDNEFNKLFVNKKKGKTKFELAKDYKKIKIKYRTYGTDLDRFEMILPWNDPNNKTLKNNILRDVPKLENVNYINFDRENRIIKFKRGVIDIDKSLIFEKGYKIIIPEGTSLNFINHSLLLSYSPVFFMGTNDNPIYVHSSDSTGQGLTILNSEDESIFNYVMFKNLNNPNQDMWQLTGAINFYQSPVQFNNCNFENNNSEDYLNVVRSNLKLNNVIFQNTKSDALDGDFITGKVENAYFYNTGNDAIDISGSEAVLKNITIKKAGDKAISAGEQSVIKIDNIDISDGEIAIASKDLSIIKGNSVKINNNKLGLTAYKKKEEYGPAALYLDNVKFSGNKTNYLIEDQSFALINGNSISTTNNVLDKMYGVEYGKSSDK